MYKYKAFVNRVIDGDTIDVTIDLGFKVFRKERLRLYGIDTPETRTRDKKEKVAGLKAKKWLKDAIEKRHIYVITHKQGKFGRYLVEIYEESSMEIWKENAPSINKMMIENKLGVEYYGGKR